MLLRKGLCLSLLSVVLVAWGSAAMEEQPTLAMVGFHEGTKRIVQCRNGYLVGMELGFVTDGWSYAEPFVGYVRLLCSSGGLTVQYTGDVQDTFLFGKSNLTVTASGKCSEGSGVGGLKWRNALIKNKDGAEARIGAVILQCNRPNNTPEEVIVAAPGVAAQLYGSEFNCKKVGAYAGRDAPRISKAFLWYNTKSFAAFEPIECE